MRTVTKATQPSRADTEKQLRGFIEKFEPKHQKLIRDVRKALRKRLPTAHELAYDNYNFFVIGYSPTERPSDAILSMAAGANGIGLCFIRGASLPDPKKVLLGSAAAIAQSKAPLRASGRGTLIIRSVSARQRPRRRTEQ